MLYDSRFQVLVLFHHVIVIKKSAYEKKIEKVIVNFANRNFIVSKVIYFFILCLNARQLKKSFDLLLILNLKT